MHHITCCSDDITALAGAMLAVQAGLAPALKDADNPFTRSRYATLNSVMEACREALTSNGIWLTQFPVPADPGFLGLVTKLVHAATGQWQSSFLVMPLPKADPQGYGSAITYARRYAISALVGIVTEEDDDGLAGTLAAPTKPKRKNEKTSSDSAQGKGPAVPPSASSAENPLLATLPRFDGIQYNLTTTQDGKTCIIASGDTRSKKQLLMQAGFRYSEQRKIWWRYAEAS